MIVGADERVKNSRLIAVRFTYFFEVLVIVALWIASIMYKNLILLSPLYLFKSSVYISISVNPIIAFIGATQSLLIFATQAIFNKSLGGKSQPIISGTTGFRFMDERERVVSDKAIFATFIYINIFFIIWAVCDIFTSGKLGLPVIIIIFTYIFYNMFKIILLHNLKERHDEK